MKILSKTLIALSLGLLSVAPVFASNGHDKPMKNHGLFAQLERQEQRINQGVKKHQLTRKEVKVLRRQQREIRNMARRFYRDGFLSKKERRLLQRELRESDRQIERMRHNDLDRYVKLHQRYSYGNHAGRL